MNNITPKISAGKSFVSRLAQNVKDRLEKLSGQPIAEWFEPDAPDAEPPLPAEPPTRKSARAARRLSPPSKLTAWRQSESPNKAAIRQRLRARQSAADAKFLFKLRQKLENAGADPTAARHIRSIPVSIRIMAADILADRSGKAAKIYLSRSHNPRAAAAIRAAVNDDMQSDRSRRIIALGLSLVALSKDTNRKGQWRRIVRGIPQTALTGILKDPWTHRRPSLSAVRGIHGEESYDRGYLDCLKNAGLCYSQQLPRAAVAPFEALGEYSVNRYWIVTPHIADLSPEELAELARCSPELEFAKNPDLLPLIAYPKTESIAHARDP
jgi:hypothetical protein